MWSSDMPDFSIRSESVNVEQIMEQIRARIREKRGIDYTEQQIRELANVKLERILDSRGLRSDLVDQFKRQQSVDPLPPLPELPVFEDTAIRDTHRGLLRLVRKVLNPILKLFFNPNPLVHSLNIQAAINKAQAEMNGVGLEHEREREKRRRELETLYFEIIHNLVLEVTRAGIEVKNLKMRVESLASRLEFNERRARSLEGVVVYRAATTSLTRSSRKAPNTTFRVSATWRRRSRRRSRSTRRCST